MADPADSADPAPWEAAAAGPPPAADRPPGWRAPARAEPRSKAAEVAAAAAVLAALLGGLVALVLWLRQPEPAELGAVPVSQYKHVTWAANPTADGDADRLLRAFDGRGTPAHASQEADRLRDLLDRLPDRAGGPVVVYVTALAAVREGRVWLLPGEARAGRASCWPTRASRPVTRSRPPPPRRTRPNSSRGGRPGTGSGLVPPG